MKIKLTKGKAATKDAYDALETALGCRLSEGFKRFTERNDGAEPETNVFKIDATNEGGVNQFIPVNEILEERSQIENLPRRAYPVAWAEGGNYVFLDEGKDGAVFFWDHEAPESFIQLAQDFGVFLDLLEPFDVKKIQLKLGQVKRAWIDPEFLKRLKK